MKVNLSEVTRMPLPPQILLLMCVSEIPLKVHYTTFIRYFKLSSDSLNRKYVALLRAKMSC